MFEVGKKYGYYPPSLDGKSNGGEYVCIGWSKEGTPVFQCGVNFFASTCPERYKEVKEPVKVSGWMNVYKERTTGKTFKGSMHDTREHAEEAIDEGGLRIACVYVSGEEGKEP